MNRCSAMETDATAFDGIPSCSFVDQERKTNSSVDI
jgi:hypothetical protein